MRGVTWGETVDHDAYRAFQARHAARHVQLAFCKPAAKLDLIDTKNHPSDYTVVFSRQELAALLSVSSISRPTVGGDHLRIAEDLDVVNRSQRVVGEQVELPASHGIAASRLSIRSGRDSSLAYASLSLSSDNLSRTDDAA